MRLSGVRVSGARRRSAVPVAVLLALAGCVAPPTKDLHGGTPVQAGAPSAVAVIVLPAPLESAFEASYADRSRAFGAGATKAGVECLLCRSRPSAPQGPR